MERCTFCSSGMLITDINGFQVVVYQCIVCTNFSNNCVFLPRFFEYEEYKNLPKISSDKLPPKLSKYLEMEAIKISKEMARYCSS